MKPNQSTPKDNPGVIAPPPLLVLGGLVLGWLLDWALGWHLAINSGPGIVLGFIVIVLGLVPLAAAFLHFRAAKTPAPPWLTPSALVGAGPYRFIRNPMYVGMLVIYLGIAIVSGSGAAFIFLPVVALLLHFGVVRREEAYLEKKFGEDYLDYCKRVPRWFPRSTD